MIRKAQNYRKKDSNGLLRAYALAMTGKYLVGAVAHGYKRAGATRHLPTNDFYEIPHFVPCSVAHGYKRAGATRLWLPNDFYEIPHSASLHSE